MMMSNDDFAYGDELDSGRKLMPDSLTTLPIILHPPLRRSTQGEEFKHYPQNKYCKDC